MPEVDKWSITTDSHQFIKAKVPKPKSSRRTVVNRVINECKSRRDRHGQFYPLYLGHEEDSQSAPLGTARHPERNRGARPLSLPVVQQIQNP
jgi:hypothetical protein